jgi:hypothetical protein
MSELTETIVAKIKPYVLGWIQDAQAAAIGAHDLGGKLHTGTILDSQAPQFVKTDGSRTLIGNLAVADGITIDGVDISVLASSYATHAGLSATAAHGSVGAHNHQSTGAGGQLDHGLALSGLGDDDHTQYAHANGYGTRSAYQAERLNKSVIAGAHMTGGGLLTADRTIDVDVTKDFAWAGAHTFSGLTEFQSNAQFDAAAQFNDLATFTSTSTVSFQGDTTARHILPEATDTYDLGSSTKLWRKGWLSELDTILFSQNTQVLLGGWFVVSKGEGSLPADLSAADTTCDFGQVMTAGDFVELRSSLAVEYIQVGSLVSGTTYNVTRNLDGSGANDWPAGMAYRINGQSGNGRIELNAFTSPRISILSQGAAYNVQTEQGRFGDLNGNWGYSAETYGIALGQYASGVGNLTYDQTNGLRLRTYSTTVMQFNSDNADIIGRLRMPGTSSAIAIGNPPPTGSAAGTGLWIDRTGLYSLAGGVYQVKIDATTGKLYAGNGNVLADSNGLSILTGDGPGNAIAWYPSFAVSPVASIGSALAGSSYTEGWLNLSAYGSSSLYSGVIYLQAIKGTNYTSLKLRDGGLTLSSGGTNSADFYYGGDLKAYRGSAYRTGYIFVPFTTPVNSSGYYGTGYSSGGNYLMDTSAHFSGVPSGIKAILLNVTIRDSGSSGADCYIGFNADNAGVYGSVCRCSGLGNDKYASADLLVPCNSSGDAYIRIVASGSATMDIYIKCSGYYI